MDSEVLWPLDDHPRHGIVRADGRVEIDGDCLRGRIRDCGLDVDARTVVRQPCDPVPGTAVVAVDAAPTGIACLPFHADAVRAARRITPDAGRTGPVHAELSSGAAHPCRRRAVYADDVGEELAAELATAHDADVRVRIARPRIAVVEAARGGRLRIGRSRDRGLALHGRSR